MTIFNIIEPMEYPNKSLSSEPVVKIVAKKHRSRDKDEEKEREFIPVFMDDGNR